MANDTYWIIRSDNATRYAAYTPSDEEEQALIAVALSQMTPEQRIEVSKLLLERVQTEPDRPFLPLLWVKDELQPPATLGGTRRR